MDALESKKYEAFVVGGCVRDSMMGKQPSDWDICTSAKPEQVKAALCDHRIIETGIKHGTVTVLTDDGSYEVTTYRTESSYSDHRHPDKVEFTPYLLADLARRDFTVNAMAYNKRLGLVDWFGGKKDLQAKVIKCVGDPNERFKEDALRILRALRFAATYGFTIDEETYIAARSNKALLQKISAERISSELTKLLCGKYAYAVLKNYSEIVTEVLPELKPCIGFEQNSLYHDCDVYEHIIRSVAVYDGHWPVIKWALLLHDIGKPACYTEDETGGHFRGHELIGAEMAKSILERLRFDNESKAAVVQLVREHNRHIEPNRASVQKLMSELGEEQTRRLLKVRRADQTAHAEGTRHLYKVDRLEAIVNGIIKDEACFQIKDLDIDGHDLMVLGIPEGPQIGTIMKKLLNDVIFGEAENRKSALLERAKEYLRRN